MNASILVVDDDPDVVSFLVEMLGEAGYQVAGRTSPLEALAHLRESPYDLVIADIEMPQMRGIELLQAILHEHPSLLVILITAFGSIELGVQAVRTGACDFVAKPFKIETLILAVERALRERQLRREVIRLRRQLPAAAGTRLVAKSRPMQRALELARRAAGCDLTVLITGESGTGKGALARFIHESSQRKDAPFVQINCAALPATLVESELFGVEKGAFTDARTARPGLFREAHGGTLFLDEIGELPIESQTKLLQALETGRVRPLGTTTEVPVDVRVIAATNQPLEEALRHNRFRPDLYYRLNVIRFTLPPLRERPEDILELVDAFLERACDRLDRRIVGVSAQALQRLLTHRWAGNVRELANTIERAVALAEHDTLLPEDFGFLETGGSPGDRAEGDDARPLEALETLEEVERAHILRVLSRTGGNKQRAARILGIDRRTLHRKLSEWLPRHPSPPEA